jgi:2'-hydroxyisoflavone reductase
VSPWGDLPVWTGGEQFATIASGKAMAAGLTFADLAATTRDTLAWWATLPAERTAKLRAGLSAEREAAILAGTRR